MAILRKNPNKGSRKGAQYAENVVFNAGKCQLMAAIHLRKIGKSVKFHELFLAVCKEDPKGMKALMQRGERACREGETETLAAKKERMLETQARIAKSEMRCKRATAADLSESGPEVKEYVRHEWFGGPQEDSDAVMEDSIAITESPASQNLPSQVRGPQSIDPEGTDDEVMRTEVKEEALSVVEAEVEVVEENDGAEEDSDEEDSDEEGSDEEGSDEEDSDEEDYDDEEDEQQPKKHVESTKHARELALIQGETLQIDDDHCRTTLASKFIRSRAIDVDAEFEAILEKCIMKLEPEAVKDALVEYLDNRLETASNTNVPTASDTSTTEEILDVLRVLNNISEDTLIRSAYAQMLLYRSVQRQVTSETSAFNKLKDILHDLTAKRAGNVSTKEKKKTYSTFERDHYHGKRWLDVVDMFEDYGIVILFIIAGVGTWNVTNQWTEYQRECLFYISLHLQGIKKLIKALGPKSLERYCRSGCLDRETVDRVDDADVFEG